MSTTFATNVLLRSPALARLGWTLLHACWQVTLVALGLAVILGLMRRASARARHVVACGFVGLAILGPVVTFALIPLPAPVTPAAASRVPVLVRPAREKDAPPPAGSGSSVSPLLPDARPSAPSAMGSARSATPMPWRAWRETMGRRVAPFTPWLALGWAVGVALLSGRLLLGWRHAGRLRRLGVRPAAPEWQARLATLAGRMRVHRPVLLLESVLAEVPAVVGALRPVILLPVGIWTGLSVAQVEMILAHELAHVHRHDYLVNLALALFETLGFFHPAAWWLAAVVRREREHACDDLAVAACCPGGDARPYARALASLEGLRVPAPAVAVGAAGDDGVLLARVRRLLGKSASTVASRRDNPPAAVPLTAGLLTLLLAGLVAWQALGGARLRAQEVSPTPPAPENALSGRVVDQAGRPVGGAEVYDDAGGGDTRGPDAPARTDVEGRFRLPRLKHYGDQERTVLVRLRDEAVGWAVVIDRGLARDNDLLKDPIVLRPRMIALHGTCVDEAGGPIAGARVAVTSLSSGLGPNRQPGDRRPRSEPFWHSLETTSDAAGRFRLTMPRGDGFNVEVRAPGRVVVRPFNGVQWRADGDLGRVELPAAGRIAGRILRADATGEVGLEHAFISATETTAGVKVEPPGPRQFWNDQETGPDGRFTVEHVPPGDYILTLVVIAGVEDRDHSMTVLAAENVHVVAAGTTEVGMRGVPARTLIVRVVDAVTGAPVRDVSVDHEGADRPRSAWTWNGRRPVGTDGEARLTVPAGRHRVIALGSGWPAEELASAEVEVPTERDPEPVRLAIRPRHQLRGTVRDPDGRPVMAAGSRFAFVRLLGAPERVRGQSASSDGDITLDLSPGEGRGRLAVDVPGFKPFLSGEVSLAEPLAPLSVVLEAATPAPVRGRVVDAAGSPVPGAWVRAMLRNGADTYRLSLGDDAAGQSEALTDADGRFESRRLRVGDEFTLAVSLEDLPQTTSDSLRITGPEGIEAPTLTLAPVAPPPEPTASTAPAPTPSPGALARLKTPPADRAGILRELAARTDLEDPHAPELLDGLWRGRLGEAGTPLPVEVENAAARFLDARNPAAVRAAISVLMATTNPALLPRLARVAPVLDAEVGFAFGLANNLYHRGDPGPLDRLCAQLRDPATDPGRRRELATFLFRADPRRLAPLYVDLLGDTDPTMRYHGRGQLRRLTGGDDFGFDDRRPPGEQPEALARWRDWLARRGPALPEREPADPDGFLGVALIDRSGRGGSVVSVSGVNPDSPASAAGLLPGDVITAVDDRSAAGRNSFELVTYELHAPAGTPVRLTVRRPGSAGELTFNLVRIPRPVLPSRAALAPSTPLPPRSERTFDPALLTGIVLPEQPTREQVTDYIRRILDACAGLNRVGTGDPPVEMLKKVGPENLDLLLSAANPAAHELGDHYLLYAVEALADERHRALVIQHLPRMRELVRLVVRRGWVEAARPILVGELERATASPGVEDRSATGYFPQEWLRAVAGFGDPTNYPALVRYFVFSSNHLTNYEVLRDLPGVDLPAAVAEGWKRERRGFDTFSRRSMALVAVLHGHADALADVFSLLDPGADERDFTVRRARQLVLDLTPARGDNAALQRWFEANHERLQWDPAARRYLVTPAPEPAPGGAGPASGGTGAAVAAGSLLFRVVQRGNEAPSADTEVRVFMKAEDKDAAPLLTDAAGICLIPLPEPRPTGLSVRVRRPGFVPMRVDWHLDQPSFVLPAAYTLALEPGTTIGGTVRDADGQPVAGASVVLILRGSNMGGRSEEVFVDAWETRVPTDAAGRWEFREAPSELRHRGIRVEHPDYVRLDRFNGREFPTDEQLRDGSAVFTLRRGGRVEGTVTDPAGKPIPHATILPGRDRMDSTSKPAFTTDDAGRFVIPHAPPGALTLTVKAHGHAPALESVRVPTTGVAEPLTVTLEPGRTLRLRVVDADGRGLPGVLVAANSWQGRRTLETCLETDAEGRVVWASAPPDPVDFAVLHTGYQSLRNVPLTASDAEQTLTLRRPLHVVGTVTNARTGERLRAFQLLTGNVSPDGQRFWVRDTPRTFRDGSFEFVFGDPANLGGDHLLRVEAEGYRSAVSRPVKDAEGEVALDLQLEPGGPAAGRVLAPDGRPLAGAEVAVVFGGEAAQIRDGVLTPQWGSLHVKTDAAGAFSFPSQEPPFALVVACPEGFAKVTAAAFAAATDIQLESWGRIEVRTTAATQPGGRPAPFYLRLAAPDAPQPAPDASTVYLNDRPVAGENGVAVFGWVVPGDVWVGRYNQPDDKAVHLRVASGQTARLDLAAPGERAVTGRVVAPAGQDGFHAGTDTHVLLRLKPDVPPPVPAGLRGAKLIAWWKEWNQTEAGRAYVAAERRYEGQFDEAEGTFRVDEVPAGKPYLLAIAVFGDGSGKPTPLGMATREFTLPEGAGGFDLGALELGPLPAEDVHEGE